MYHMEGISTKIKILLLSLLFWSGAFGQKFFTSLAADDYDAATFCKSSAANVTADVQRDAINITVKSFKAYSLWNKMICVYPMVGGNATSHSYNLKNISTYQITWVGSPVHDANGVDPNGTSAYGKITFQPSTAVSATDHSMSFYSNEMTGTGTFPTDMGNNTPGSSQYWNLALYRQGAGNSVYQSGNNGANWTTTQTTGFYGVGSMLGTGTNNITFYQFKGDHDGSSFSASIAGTSLTSVSTTVVVGAHWQDTGPQNGSTRRCLFAHIGQGLTATEVSNLFNKVVQPYETKLGRNL